ncbi:hypothetical protein C8F04DRAFT_1318892 [Mycena alexandri]|uniref:Tetraspanin Tsp2 n=1 Tax=Mycena alexandri TaxID=1745969 RepID=A0AAD6T3Z2_9AGAR|nr:hypothetical protein C8F04DRAFT_1318892 [Mycena alexandri]
MQRVWSVYLDGKRKSAVAARAHRDSSASSVASSMRHMLSHPHPHPLEPPRPAFLTADGNNNNNNNFSRSSSPDSAVSLQINYLPSKFSEPAVRQRKVGGKGTGTRTTLKYGGGVDAFRAGEARIPRAHDQEYDGVDVGVRTGKAKWNRFKWILVCSNVFYTLVSLAAVIFMLTVWFDVWEHADVVRVGNNTELILTTTAAAMALLTALIGWGGIMLNNRGFLATYTFLLWISFALLVTPGYITYKKFAFNLEGKVNKQWSTGLGGEGRLRIQNQLGCCGYFSPFVEATVSATCYARTVLPGCKLPYLDFETTLLHRWFIAVFACVPATIAAIFVGLLCSNHVTYRFGKGMMPKAYRLSPESIAIIMDSYASQLAEQYGPDMAEDILARSRSNLNLDSVPAISPTVIHRD